MQLFARRYDTAGPVCLEIAGARIERIGPCESPVGESQRWPWVAPGLIDLQLNGYGGQEFSTASLTPEKVVELVRTVTDFGVTHFCPTLTTQALEVLEHAARAIAEACQSSATAARRIAGIHLEGPYISPEDGARGAHPQEYCREPDWDEFCRLQEAAGGRIRILTMAAELSGAPAFIRRVAASGVVVALGHTAATSAQIRAAVDAGARLSTHLGNGSHPVLRRHPNYIWDQLADDRLLASLIVDGHHLPPEVVKTFVRAKSPERCILVSDLSGLAGLPPGRYSSNLCDAEMLPSGKLVIAGQTDLLVGATAPVGVGLANVMQFAGVSLAQAVEMAVHHPARLLGIEPGRLEAGQPADLVLFDLAESADSSGARQFQVRATFAGAP